MLFHLPRTPSLPVAHPLALLGVTSSERPALPAASPVALHTLPCLSFFLCSSPLHPPSSMDLQTAHLPRRGKAFGRRPCIFSAWHGPDTQQTQGRTVVVTRYRSGLPEPGHVTEVVSLLSWEACKQSLGFEASCRLDGLSASVVVIAGLLQVYGLGPPRVPIVASQNKQARE